jgi:DNA-binding Xre family transcriptional regulator
VPIRIRETSSGPQPPGGATVTSDQLVLRAPIVDVPAGATGYIRVGDALEVLLVSALIGGVAVVAWKISRGGLFDRSTTGILDWLAGAVLAAGFLPVYLGLLVVVCFRFAFTASQRMVRDQAWAGLMSPEQEDGHAVVCHLDDLLAERGLTLTELADRVGVTVVNLSVLENKRARAIRFSTLTRLREVLGCQPGDVFSVRTD